MALIVAMEHIYTKKDTNTHKQIHTNRYTRIELTLGHVGIILIFALSLSHILITF